MADETVPAVWNPEQEQWEDARTGIPLESPADAVVQAQIDGEPIFQMVSVSDPVEPDDFEKGLAELINRHSRENRSDTPDFVLANFLTRALHAFEVSTVSRDYHVRANPIGTNGAAFYVDGYTLASTDTIGEIAVRRMDSDKVVILKSSQLTGFLDRRFED